MTSAMVDWGAGAVGMAGMGALVLTVILIAARQQALGSWGSALGACLTVACSILAVLLVMSADQLRALGG